MIEDKADYEVLLPGGGIIDGLTFQKAMELFLGRPGSQIQITNKEV